MLRVPVIVVAAAVAFFAATAVPPAASAAACASAKATVTQSSRTVVARATLCLINAERRKHGLPVLRLDPRLSTAARAHSRDMVRRRYFSHTTPEGLSFAHRIRGAGYMRASRKWLVGENIAWGWRRLNTAAGVVRAWMHSPPHREEILQGSFRDVGIGVVAGVPRPLPRGGATYTVDFGVRR